MLKIYKEKLDMCKKNILSKGMAIQSASSTNKCEHR